MLGAVLVFDCDQVREGPTSENVMKRTWSLPGGEVGASGGKAKFNDIGEGKFL